MSEVKYEEPQVMRRVMDFFNRVQAEAHRHLPDAILIVNAYALPVLMHPTRRPAITAARACDQRLSKVCFLREERNCFARDGSSLRLGTGECDDLGVALHFLRDE